MIIKDQPTCFPENVLVAVSSVEDGTMLDRVMGVHDGSTVSNRTEFCKKIGIDYGDVVFQRIVYSDDRTYELICEVDEGSTAKMTSEVVADALVVGKNNVGLMLPVADCVATVLYDKSRNVLSLLHLGRHSTLTPLLARVIEKFKNEGSKAEDLIVWMSPNAHASHYVMEYFDHADDPDWKEYCIKESDGYHLDLQGFNKSVCLKQGILEKNIHTSPINTVTSPDYFSHSAGDTKGRFVVVAMLR